MYSYTHDFHSPQDVVDAKQIASVDSLPYEYGRPAADDLTIASAKFWDHRPVFTSDEMTLQTAILVAWEQGAISGLVAFEHLALYGLVDHDTMLGLFLDFLRARAALTEGRAA